MQQTAIILKSSLSRQIAENVKISKALRARALDERGVKRHRTHLERRKLGAKTRAMLLAVAFLRSRPYASIEKKTRDAAPVLDVTLAIEDIKSPSLNKTRDAVSAWVQGDVATIRDSSASWTSASP